MSDSFITLFHDCISLNEGNICKEATCNVEAWFTKLIIAQSLEHMNLPDYQELKVENGFNNTECTTATKSKQTAPEKFCCGTHHHNTKRVLRSLTQKCCENDVDGVFKLYDPVLHDCCEDGSTSTACEAVI